MSGRVVPAERKSSYGRADSLRGEGGVLEYEAWKTSQ
jgi:hypothetical protein